MSHKRKYLAFSLLMLAALPAQAYAEAGGDAESHSEMKKFISEGKAYIDARYRFEYVDQDGVANTAKASTLRTRLGFKSGLVHGFGMKVEVEDVSEIGSDAYNNTLNGKTDRPVVADPDGTEVNEAYLSYEGVENTTIHAGREAIKLDNVRFVGDVGWRQNNQTYDNAHIVNTSVPDLKLMYGFIWNVNRIFGDDSPVGDLDTETHLVNVKYTGIPAAAITAYAYLLDIEDVPGLSSSTYGVRANGSSEMNESMKLLYDGEYAYQEDYADNPTSYSAQYWRAELGAEMNGLTIRGGYESLGSDDGVAAVSTPLATLHKWNGWADKFLATPANGLNDAYAGVKYSMAGISDSLQKFSVEAIYHYFSSDEQSTKYGEEWDFNLLTKVCEHVNLGVKYARYDAANFATDTEKIIFTLQTGFSQ